MRTVRGCFLFTLILLCGISFASDNRFVRIDPAIVNNQLKNVPADTAERVRMMRSSFLLAGCTGDQITEQAIPGEAAPNVFCTLPGKEEGTIVVAARLDFRSKGEELAVDNATLHLLPLLAQSLQPTGRRYSFVFLALSGSDHRKGSAYYLAQLTDAQRKSIRGMIFLDHLGRSPARYLFPSQANDSNIASISRDVTETNFGGKRTTHSDTALRKQLGMAAKAVKLEDPDELAEFYFTDALNFEHQRIMALTLTSPAYSILVRDFGKREVKMPRTDVDLRVYYETYNLLCIYSLYLDNTLEAKK